MAVKTCDCATRNQSKQYENTLLQEPKIRIIEIGFANYFFALVIDKEINLSQCMRFPTMWYVPPAKPQISLRIRAV